MEINYIFRLIRPDQIHEAMAIDITSYSRPIASKAESEYRYHSLDGLRGVASIMVALCHFIVAFDWSLLSGSASASHFAADTALSHTPVVILYNPDLYVGIFFVLSGFVLAASVNETSSALFGLIIRRWVRLALPILVTSLFAWIIPRFGLNFSHEASVFSRSDWLADQYAHITLSAVEFGKLIYQSLFTLMISQGDGGDIARYYNSNLWTMPIEFIGSIGLFVIYKMLLLPYVPKVTGKFIVILLVLALLWNSPFYGFPAGAGLFELQKVLRSVIKTSNSIRLMSLIAGLLILLAGLAAGGTPFVIDLQRDGFYAITVKVLYHLVSPASPITLLHHLGAFCIVAGVLLVQPVRLLLQRQIFQFLGKISFMVYLVQLPILCSVGAGLLIILEPKLGYNVSTLFAGVAYIMAVLLVATLMTWAADMPAIHLSRRLGDSFVSKHRLA